MAVKTKNKPTPSPVGATRPVACPTCGGIGKVRVRQETFADGEMGRTEVELKCQRCQGSGKWRE